MPYQAIREALARLVKDPSNLSDPDLELLRRLNLPTAASITRARALADAAPPTPAKTPRRRPTS